MKRTYVKLLTVAGLTGCFLFTSCRSAQETTARYEISKVEGNMITIDSTWDANPDKKATTVLKPYKDKVDAMMYEVIGTSEMKMDKGTPESLLSNLVASVLQEAAAQVLGKPADMGLVNMGGLRNILQITKINFFYISGNYQVLCPLFPHFLHEEIFGIRKQLPDFEYTLQIEHRSSLKPLFATYHEY